MQNIGLYFASLGRRFQSNAAAASCLLRNQRIVSVVAQQFQVPAEKRIDCSIGGRVKSIVEIKHRDGIFRETNRSAVVSHRDPGYDVVIAEPRIDSVETLDQIEDGLCDFHIERRIVAPDVDRQGRATQFIRRRRRKPIYRRWKAEPRFSILSALATEKCLQRGYGSFPGQGVT